MFDYLLVKHNCPNCGRKLNDYQAKGIPKLLGDSHDGYWKSYKIENFLSNEFSEGTFMVYDKCPDCKIDIEGMVTIKERIVKLNEFRKITTKRGIEQVARRIIELKRQI